MLHLVYMYIVENCFARLAVVSSPLLWSQAADWSFLGNANGSVAYHRYSCKVVALPFSQLFALPLERALGLLLA